MIGASPIGSRPIGAAPFVPAGGGSATYTAAGTLVSQSGVLAGSATFAPPAYTGVGVLVSQPGVLAGSAIFSTPTYTAAGALVSRAGIVAGTAIFAAAVFQGTGTLTSQSSVLTGSATFVSVFSGTGTLASQSSMISGVATFVTPTYSGVGTLISQPGTIAGTAAVANPAYTAVGILISSPAVLAGFGTFAEGVPVAGDGGSFWFRDSYEVRRVYAETIVSRVYWLTEGGTVGQNVENGETHYTTKKEDKTFGFDFSNEGAVRAGGVLSNPVVEITKHSSVAGTPTVPTKSAGPAVIDTVPFVDSDGRKIKVGKGAKVRIDSRSATAGKYTLSCTVTCTSLDGDVDTLEGGGVLVVG